MRIFIFFKKTAKFSSFCPSIKVERALKEVENSGKKSNKRKVEKKRAVIKKTGVPDFCKFIFSIGFILLVSSGVNAQQTKAFESNRNKVGFMYGYGEQSLLGTSYTYKVFFFQAQYYYTFHRKNSWNLEILAQPQANFSRYTPKDNGDLYQNGHELGLNAGFLARRSFSKEKFSIYGFVSSGPHYVSGIPQKQSSGFIFSNNLFLGASHQIYRGLYLDVRAGFRHLSNLGIEKPNGGINNTIINAGFYYKL